MRAGACHCGAVRYVIDGPVRDVLICHCDSCVEATGAPWAASAAARTDLALADDTALEWKRATVSEHDASRGSCRSCGTLILWDAPGRATLSFAVDTLSDASDLEVAGRIWIGEATPDDAVPAYPEGLPDSAVIPWRS